MGTGVKGLHVFKKKERKKQELILIFNENPCVENWYSVKTMETELFMQIWVFCFCLLILLGL